MEEERKSGVQKFFTSLVSPETAARMEADSRAWMLQCPRCGFERSFWDIGGIRYKATGNQRNLLRCPQCGQVSWHKAYKREGPLPDIPAPASSTTPATASTTRGHPIWLRWTLFLILPLVIFFVLLYFGIFYFVSGVTQPVVTVGDEFMTALKSNSDARAYALCAPDLQQELGSTADLSSLVQGYRPSEWNWDSRSIRNGVGRLSGSYTSVDGKRGTVQLTLDEVGNDWRIVSFSFN
jgi:hypothetical protein